MSRTINKVILVGNVGRDPDVYETKKGTKAVHLSLATNRLPFGDEAEQRTDWHRLTLWAGLAQFTEENVKKGDRIYVEGRLEDDAHEREGIRISTADVQRARVGAAHCTGGGSPSSHLAFLLAS
jgi:single-strand DNA-binding protein